jgi:hypothetical protein
MLNPEQDLTAACCEQRPRIVISNSWIVAGNKAQSTPNSNHSNGWKYDSESQFHTNSKKLYLPVPRHQNRTKNDPTKIKYPTKKRPRPPYFSSKPKEL